MPRDLLARTSRRLDLQDVPCALIKVQAPQLNNLSFRSNMGIIGEVQYDYGEYYVYVPDGTRKLTVKHADFAPITIVFEKLQSLHTYKLLIEVHQIHN